ncbi:MAG TPA: DNA primase [Limosilactobacillus oris]|uniref:DNA primase n=1 Tax=Limosilactobacillus oris TaxID=1632 RepID=UPI001D7E142B|nr:DNA primase [Limosilactobacillus oris]HJF48159.1 DNA primase [Limosilactobacillus oris]
MARIPRAVIDEVRNSVDIVDVIGRYVQLKKAGKNFTGLCPFHNEQTPSFSVNAEKQYYHCFGCGRSGNVFQFLMDYQHINFVEAVAAVAKDAGISLPEQYVQSSNRPAAPVDSETGQLIQLHQKAAELYRYILVGTPAGEAGLHYLTRRGVSRELIDQFQLGFAPEQQVLKAYCDKEKLDYQLLRKSGLFTEDREGQLHDRFANRVMYPIKNRRGQVIAFSGRLLSTANTDLPKYLNSPETPIFNKRRTLFNLDVARKAARQDGKLYLFEGFMDVISAFGAGIQGGVASMGTSFTEEQVETIHRTTTQLDICYDGDSAGQNAIDRAIKLVESQQTGNLQVRVVQLPAGVDPDEYVQRFGPEKFRQYLASQEETTVDFYLRFLRQGRNLDQQGERMDYLNQVLKVIATVPTPLEEDLYLSKLAQEFSLDKAALQSQLTQVRAHTGIRQPRLAPGQRNQLTSQSPAAVVESRPQVKISRAELAEQMLLYYMLHSQEVWAHVTATAGFHFVHERYQTLYLLAASYFTEHGDYSVADFLNYLNEDELRTTLSQIEQLRVNPAVQMPVIDDCMHIITRQTPLDDQINQVQKQLREANTLNNTELVMKLTVKLVDLLKEQQQYKAEETN